jgi:WW domain
MNRVWYQHNASRYKTYVQPQIASISSLPAGWEQRHNQEGRAYYVHVPTGRSSWSTPAWSLPKGWKEIKTPEGRPFYVHEEFQLSTWTWPGQQPVQNAMPRIIQHPGPIKAAPKTSKPTQPNITSRRTASMVNGVGITTKFSASAADIASDPFAGATKAITSGVMLAAKSFKKNKNARKMLSRVGMKSMKQIAESAISAGGDGEDADFGDDDDNEVDCGVGDDAGLQSCGPGDLNYGSNDCATTEFGQGFDAPPQQGVYLNPSHVEPRAETTYGEPFMQQGSNIDSSDQVSNFPAYYQETPPPIVHNVMMAEHGQISSHVIDPSVNREVVGQGTQSCVDEAITNNQSTDQAAQECADQSLNEQVIGQGTQSYVGLSNDTQSISPPASNWDTNQQPGSNIEAQQSEVVSAGSLANSASTVYGANADNQSNSVNIPPPTSSVCDAQAEGAPVTSAADPCSDSYIPSDPALPAGPEQAPSPFVFQPMPAAPLMTEPAASSDGVVYTPQYPPIYDGSNALALI